MGIGRWITAWRARGAGGTADLLPLLVPGEFATTTGWPGPIVRLPLAEFALTWGLVPQPDHTTYVTHEMAARWERNGTKWRAHAAENLRRLAEEHPFSHRFVRADGTIHTVAMLFPGNLAMARLLVPGLLDEVFPAGYRVAIPERTCVVASTADASEMEREHAEKLVRECHDNGSEPISQQFFDPKLFW